MNYTDYMMNQPFTDGEEIRGFLNDKVETKPYTLEFKNPTHKDIAKRIIIEEGGEIIQGFQCYCYYCLEYSATEEQDAEIVKRLEYIGLL